MADFEFTIPSSKASFNLRTYEFLIYRASPANGESLSAFHGRPMIGPGTRATIRPLQLRHSISFLTVSGLKPTRTSMDSPHSGQSTRMITGCENSPSSTDAPSDSRFVRLGAVNDSRGNAFTFVEATEYLDCSNCCMFYFRHHPKTAGTACETFYA